jgi:hypothetical protein
MQLRLPWSAPATRSPPAAPSVVVDGRTFAIRVARHRRARRYVLRLTTDGALRLTVPRGSSIAGGVRFTERQSDWIAREWRRQQESAAPWTTGTTLWMRGERVTLEVHPDRIVCRGMVIRRLRGAEVREVVEGHWRDLASHELVPRTVELAGACRVSISRVSVRNQRSRWGACSARGVITLNWRLIQMPASVSDYVIFHELMHRRQPNHSRKFWREVESVCAGWREAERWLRKHGREVF